MRDVAKDDCPIIMTLIQQLAEFENMRESVKINGERLQDDFVKGRFECAVCQNVSNGTIVGFAIYVYTFDLAVGRKVYLEDLYVRERYRSRGHGRKLWDYLLAKGRSEDCVAMEFSVLRWNKSAIEFYINRGANNITKADSMEVYRFNIEPVR